LSSLTAVLVVFVDNGCHQRRQQWVEPTALIVVIDGGIVSLCQ
jgi:hypothetical protein